MQLAINKELIQRVPSWVIPGAIIDFDFENNRFYQNGASSNTPDNLLSTSRASVGYVDDVNGNWTSVAANLTRFARGKGLLVEEARTNIVLRNRDLTNASWTKTNITAALDQVGVDGVTNSASSLTATAGNGTALQAITLASSARWQTAFVKRLVGSGTINMTMDNGTTWTAIAPTSSWSRLSIPTQTLANPTVGFRIVTNGDKIAVDLVQNENSGVFATSPILTAGSSVARAADVVSLASLSALNFIGNFSLFAAINPIGLPAANQFLVTAYGSSEQNRIACFRTAGGLFQCNDLLANVTQFNQAVASPAIATGVKTKVARSYAPGRQDLTVNGTNGGAGSGTGVITQSLIRIGSNLAGTGSIYSGYFVRIAIFPNGLSLGTLNNITG